MLINIHKILTFFSMPGKTLICMSVFTFWPTVLCVSCTHSTRVEVESLQQVEIRNSRELKFLCKCCCFLRAACSFSFSWGFLAQSTVRGDPPEMCCWSLVFSLSSQQTDINRPRPPPVTQGGVRGADPDHLTGITRTAAPTLHPPHIGVKRSRNPELPAHRRTATRDRGTTCPSKSVHISKKYVCERICMITD